MDCHTSDTVYTLAYNMLTWFHFV